MRTPHTTFYRGKRLLIVFRDGRREVDRFVDRIGRGMVLERLGVVPVSDLRSVSMFSAPHKSHQPR